ncbi:MAG: hypothetical protein ACPLPT_10390 [Moorellales bacterium]
MEARLCPNGRKRRVTLETPIEAPTLLSKSFARYPRPSATGWHRKSVKVESLEEFMWLLEEI